MAVEAPGYKLPGIKVASSISSDLDQFSFVTLNGDFEVVPSGGSSESPVGIVQNTPTGGEAADIVAEGMTKVHTGASTMAAGDRIGANSSAHAVTIPDSSDSDKYIAGYMMESAGSDVIGTAVVDCLVTDYNKKS